jgi:hypothetical protein
MEDIVTNEVLLERLNNLIETNREEHARIEEQVARTNGSVARIKAWTNILKGGLGVITVLVLPILFILIEQWIRR